MTLANEIEELFKEIYFTDQYELEERILEREYKFKSVIYIMTHLIINKSNYYEQFAKGCDWVLSFFSRYLDRIIEKTTTDILAEVGLCYRLCQEEKNQPKQYDMIIQRLKDRFDSSKLQDREFLINHEHPNSILMMLFRKDFKLFKGPDLSNHQVFNKLVSK